MDDNTKISKLLESKSKETIKIMDKVQKQMIDFHRNYLHCFKYPDDLLGKLETIESLINNSNKSSDEIICELKKILNER